MLADFAFFCRPTISKNLREAFCLGKNASLETIKFLFDPDGKVSGEKMCWFSKRVFWFDLGYRRALLLPWSLKFLVIFVRAGNRKTAIGKLMFRQFSFSKVYLAFYYDRLIPNFLQLCTLKQRSTCSRRWSYCCDLSPLPLFSVERTSCYSSQCFQLGVLTVIADLLSPSASFSRDRYERGIIMQKSFSFLLQ